MWTGKLVQANITMESGNLKGLFAEEDRDEVVEGVEPKALLSCSISRYERIMNEDRNGIP